MKITEKDFDDLSIYLIDHFYPDVLFDGTNLLEHLKIQFISNNNEWNPLPIERFKGILNEERYNFLVEFIINKRLMEK